MVEELQQQPNTEPARSYLARMQEHLGDLSRLTTGWGHLQVAGRLDSVNDALKALERGDTGPAALVVDQAIRDNVSQMQKARRAGDIGKWNVYHDDGQEGLCALEGLGYHETSMLRGYFASYAQPWEKPRRFTA